MMPNGMQTFVRRIVPALLLTLMVGGVLLAADGGEDDLYDPDEAARYRKSDKPLAERILETGEDSPTTQPEADESAATQPESPFAVTPQTRRDLMPGCIELSDGRLLAGTVYTTRDKPWSVFEASSASFRRIPPTIVKRIDAVIIWERDQPEWRWKEGGSDEKVYTGRTYPARKQHYRFTLINGLQITGTVQQPIYVAAGEQAARFILHERDKGEVGQSLGDVVFVRSVRLGKEALDEAKKQLEERSKNPTTQPAPASRGYDPADFDREVVANPTDLDRRIGELADVVGVRVHHLGDLKFEILVPRAAKEGPKP